MYIYTLVLAAVGVIRLFIHHNFLYQLVEDMRIKLGAGASASKQHSGTQCDTDDNIYSDDNYLFQYTISFSKTPYHREEEIAIYFFKSFNSGINIKGISTNT